MYLLRRIIILLYVAIPSLVNGQINGDSIPCLEEVVVEVNRFRSYTVGAKVQQVDSSLLQQYKSGSLSDLLAQQSNIFLKSYGLNNIGSVSVRGTGAAHTAVVWNGFSIQNPSLGQSDFSLIPVSSIDELYIQYGGGGALYGSGSVGATVHMVHTPQFNKGVKAAITNSNSSFSDNYQSLSFSLSKKRFISSTKMFNHFGRNNYSYIINGDKVKLNDASFKQHGILQESFILLNDKQQLNFRIWWQENDRNIPPINNELTKAHYVNNFIRLSSEWRSIGLNKNFYLRQAYFNERTRYNDGFLSVTNFQTFITEAETKFYLKELHSFNLGINNTYNFVASDGYELSRGQNRISFFGAYKIHNRRNSVILAASLRKEFVSGFSIPIAPSIGVDYVIVKWLKLKTNVSRTYRVPTFNDLYWNPGGNPNLKPENGWSEEIGLVTTLKGKSSQVINEFTLFNSNVSNWIIWLPSSGTIWVPQNFQYVWARGLEETIKINKSFGRVKAGFTASYSYVLSTNEKVKSPTDNSLHKQLIFVPIYSAYGNLYTTYKAFTLTYNQTFTGNRFTSSDNAYFIKGYSLGNIILDATLRRKQYIASCQFKVNNIWNINYRAIPQSPMPLRYCQLSVSLFYN